MNNIVMNRIYEFSIWISNMLYINILWLAYTLFGGIVLGIFPSTVSMLYTVKKLSSEKNEFNIKSEFATCFKKEFKKSNKVFFPFFIAGFILIADIRFISLLHFEHSGLVTKVFYMLFFLLIMIFLYSLIVYMESDAEIKSIFKRAFFILLYNPMTNLYVLTGFFLLYSLSINITGFFFFFSGSVFGWFLLFIVLKTSKKFF